MICNRITVSDFRNIRAADVTFSEGVNILHGKNAQGKTNLLEAIHLVSVGRSFRGAKEAEMIGFDAPFSTVSVDFTDAVRRQNLTLRIFRGKKRQIEQNKVKLTKMSEMIGQYRTVLFCPEHLSIVKEGPALRRNFLDVAISQLRPMYLHSLQRYNQILRERNQLIKNAAEDRHTFDSTVEFWSLQLAREAAVIATLRCEYLTKAKDYVKESFCEMTAGAEIPDLCYVGAGFRELDAEIYTDREAVERRYTELLTTHYDREIAAGMTLWGIHRDDMDMTINGHAARSFASQGQQRSLSLALKLAEGEICRRETGENPVFLLDDVFSELDGSRREYLCDKISGKQIIITSCEPNLISDAKRIEVRAGTFTE
ncbi:MAG: DNA replication/repair protein RecF [Clostridia bacterium]|nr:DNA replication/repair protein RecF [Clostridia bacterium]